LIHIFNREGTPTARTKRGRGKKACEKILHEQQGGERNYLENGSKSKYRIAPHQGYRAQRFEFPNQHSTTSRSHPRSQMRSGSHPENNRNYPPVTIGSHQHTTFLNVRRKAIHTQSVCPLSSLMHCPVEASHILRVLSADADTICSPLGENTQHSTWNHTSLSWNAKQSKQIAW